MYYTGCFSCGLIFFFKKYRLCPRILLEWLSAFVAARFHWSWQPKGSCSPWWKPVSAKRKTRWYVLRGSPRISSVLWENRTRSRSGSGRVSHLYPRAPLHTLLPGDLRFLPRICRSSGKKPEGKGGVARVHLYFRSPGHAGILGNFWSGFYPPADVQNKSSHQTPLTHHLLIHSIARYNPTS